MKRPLDIIPELVNAVYSTTSDSVVQHNGVLYAVLEHIHDLNILRNLVIVHQSNLVVMSIRRTHHRSYNNEEQFVCQYTVINPARTASNVRFHILK